MTASRASVQDRQNPACAVHREQRSVGTSPKSRFVSQLSMDWEPRKETTITLLVWSRATKPVTSVRVSVLKAVSGRWTLVGRAYVLAVFENGCGICMFDYWAVS